MSVVSYGVRCSFQRTPKDNKQRGGTIVSSAINKPQLATFSPAVARHWFSAVTQIAVVAETARDIRRSLPPSIFPLEQSATQPSSRKNVDQSARGHHQTGGRDANRSISHEPQCAPFRKKYRAFPLRSLT